LLQPCWLQQAASLHWPSTLFYAKLSVVFLQQALVQDIANLLLAAPALVILALLPSRGSLRAYLLWLGVLTFTIYNYFIYAFSVPFGSLFLLWVAVLGMCIYALISGLVAIDYGAAAMRFMSERTTRVGAWFLIIVALFFGFLWLSDDLPALAAGATPQSLIEMGLPTNPVHVLDLAFFLPAAFATGAMLLRRRPLAYTVAPALIVFVILTGGAEHAAPRRTSGARRGSELGRAGAHRPAHSGLSWRAGMAALDNYRLGPQTLTS
jgi:hypothetical protein